MMSLAPLPQPRPGDGRRRRFPSRLTIVGVWIGCGVQIALLLFNQHARRQFERQEARLAAYEAKVEALLASCEGGRP